MDNKNDLDIKPNFEGGGGRWDGEDIITLHVEDQLFLLSFKIEKKTIFRKLMRNYCNKKGLDLGAVRFRYEIFLNKQSNIRL